MQLERFRRYFQFQITYLEKALLKNDAQDILAKRALGVTPCDRRRDTISRVNADKIACSGHTWKCEEIQSTVNGIDCEKARVRSPTHTVLHAIEPIGDISLGNSLQRAATHSPIESREPRTGKRAQGFVLSDVWLQSLNVSCTHGIPFAARASGSKSTGQRR